MGSVKKQVEARKKARRAAIDEDRFAVDILLRRRGFRILSRRQGREAVWERGGKSFLQGRALRTIPFVEALHAEALERAWLRKRYGTDAE